MAASRLEVRPLPLFNPPFQDARSRYAVFADFSLSHDVFAGQGRDVVGFEPGCPVDLARSKLLALSFNKSHGCALILRAP